MPSRHQKLPRDTTTPLQPRHDYLILVQRKIHSYTSHKHPNKSQQYASCSQSSPVAWGAVVIVLTDKGRNGVVHAKGRAVHYCGYEARRRC